MNPTIEKMIIDPMKVKSDSVPQSVAGAVAGKLRDRYEAKQDLSAFRVELSAIGAGAVNQTVKALIIARQYLATSNLLMSVHFGFEDLKMEDNNERTAIKFIVAARII